MLEEQYIDEETIEYGLERPPMTPFDFDNKYFEDLFVLCDVVAENIESLNIETLKRLFEATSYAKDKAKEIMISTEKEFRGGISDLTVMQREIQSQKKIIKDLKQKKDKILGSSKIYAKKNLGQQLAGFDKKIQKAQLIMQHHQEALEFLHELLVKYGGSKSLLEVIKMPTEFLENTEQFLSQLKYGTYDLIEQINLHNRADVKPDGLYAIFGDPGWGKTIQLRQFTEKLLLNQIKNGINHKIPIFVKAKVLSEKITNIATDNYGISIDMPDGSVVEHYGSSTSNHGESVDILKQAIFESEPDINAEIVEQLFAVNRNVLANMVLIIDAYDEIQTSNARLQIIDFINDQIARYNSPVIITSRKSHQKELAKVFSQFNESSHKFISLEIFFTNEELRFVMPTKLANAWGINSAQLSSSVSQQFKQSRKS